MPRWALHGSIDMRDIRLLAQLEQVGEAVRQISFCFNKHFEQKKRVVFLENFWIPQLSRAGGSGHLRPPPVNRTFVVVEADGQISRVFQNP